MHAHAHVKEVALPDDEEMNDWIAVHGKITTDHVTIDHVIIV